MLKELRGGIPVFAGMTGRKSFPKCKKPLRFIFALRIYENFRSAESVWIKKRAHQDQRRCFFIFSTPE
jgi:hypothetical protein